MDPELRIIELEEEIELLKHDLKNQQNVNFEWSGSLGKWEWYIAENRVVFNDKKIQALGYNRNELPEEIGYSFFTEKIHPDDNEQTMQKMRQHMYGQTPAYEKNTESDTKMVTGFGSMIEELYIEGTNSGNP